MENELQTFKYHSSTKSKLINKSHGERSEIYRIGKKTYVVTGSEGQKTIVDVDEMKQMSKSTGFDISQFASEIEKPEYKVKNTGKKVKVGGINGEVWIISGVYDGKKYREEIVVTKDRRVVKAVRAMFGIMTSMSGLADDENLFEIKKGYVTIKGKGLELKSFSDKKVSSSEYKLPQNAKKQKMPEFKETKKQPESKPSTTDDIDIGEAVNMLKSFF
jgi:hypothetical protein